jgi:flavin reductase (DIM6/NTAB) family NADH-FMN oxidoreductase RutF
MNHKTALKAVGRVPSGLFVLTAGKGESAIATLVSFVQQLSIDPLLLGVALKPARAASAVLAREKHFVINILHAGDKSLLRAFAKKSASGKDAFAAVDSRPLPTGGAVLLEACAFIECELTAVLDVAGDHSLYVGRVVGGDLLGDPGAKPTVHVRQDGGKY